MKTPFFSLERQLDSLKPELEQAAKSVFNSARFISGKFTSQFEKEFAAYIGTTLCLSCGNATDGLELVLRAMDIGFGDEVVVPAFTWISDAEAVKLVGANPIFADVETHSFNMSAEQLEGLITSSTKAIIFTHLYGNSEGFEAVKTVAEKYELKLIEDCAQAHGALVNGKKVGSLGHTGVFSFYPTKNLGAYGDAGAVTTNDPVLAEKIRRLANHGQLERDIHIGDGRNSRMDEIQAAYLSIKLKHLDAWNQRRNEISALYSKNIKGDLNLPSAPISGNHVFHQFVVISENRDELKNRLMKAGIGTAIHYPNALPFFEAYFKPAYSDKFLVAKKLSSQVLSLPIWPELSDSEVHYIIEQVNAAI